MQQNTIIYQAPTQERIFTLEEIQKRRVQRRRRVSKRMMKRFPLFAVEFMRDEFPDIDQDTVILDAMRKTRKRASSKKVKSPMIRQGRYPLYVKAMSNYKKTKERKYLEEAQRWRNRMYLPYRCIFKLKNEKWEFYLPSFTSIRVIEKLSKIDFQNWDEFIEKYNHIVEYTGLFPIQKNDRPQ